MALLFTVLLSAAVLSLGYFLYDFGRESLEQDSESALDLEINNILLLGKIEADKSLETIIDERIDPEKGIHYLLSDLRGQRLAGDLEAIPRHVDLLTEGVLVFEVDSIPGKPESGHRVAAKIHTFSNGYQLLIARDIEEFLARFARLRLLSILSIGCMMMVIVVSFLISLFVVSRINRMSNTAMEIMDTGDLSRRLSIDSRWDDLSHLARVLNEMLSRIEGLLDGVKQVSNNIAHDLRTPLTRLRNRLESIDSEYDDAGEVTSIIEEADQILETFNSLLRISRLEVGQERAGFASINLAKIVEDVMELYEPIIDDLGLHLEGEISQVHSIRGDHNLLFQAIVNVLDNAIKHGGEGKEIKIKLHSTSDGSAELQIEDSGNGISDKEKKKVFQRFYRCDESRTKPGSGLGLSMVDTVVRLHDASIALYDASIGGLGVRITFPTKLW
jgi:signal transduction histidine kinase